MDLILEVCVKFLKRTFRPLFEDGFVYSIGSRSVDWGHRFELSIQATGIDDNSVSINSVANPITYRKF